MRHAMVRDPYCVQPDDLCLDALRELRARGIRHAPVVAGKRLVGVVSERDLLRALPRLVGALDTAEGRRDATTLVSAVMAPEPTTCDPGAPFDVVARELEHARIGCMPVLEEGRLVGIVTIDDLLRGFTRYLAEPGTRALTLLWTRGAPEDAPDVLALCASHRLRVRALLETETESGARIFLLRTSGAVGARSAFVEECVAAGLLLVDERAAA